MSTTTTELTALGARRVRSDSSQPAERRRRTRRRGADTAPPRPPRRRPTPTRRARRPKRRRNGCAGGTERRRRRAGRRHDRARRGRGRGQPHRLGRLRRGRLDRPGGRLGDRRSRRRPVATSTSRLGNTSDEMVQLMQSGEYDGVSASGDATLRLIAGGEVVARQHRPHPELRRRLRGPQGPAAQLRRRRALRRAPRPRRQPARVQHRRVPSAAPDSWGVMFEATAPPRAACRCTTRRSTSPTPRCT